MKDAKKIRSRSDITPRVKDLIADKLDKTVYVKSDRDAKYGVVVSVVDSVRAAGVDALGLLTEKREQTHPTAPPVTPQ